MNNPDVQPDDLPNRQVELRGDRPYTYLITGVSLIIGLILAGIVGAILLSLRQPLTQEASGKVIWSWGAVMLPAAGLICTLILAWSVFFLPLRFSRRSGIVLDPIVWPMAGAVAVGVIVIIAFIGAMIVGVI
jgi:hypothetical protein